MEAAGQQSLVTWQIEDHELGEIAGDKNDVRFFAGELDVELVCTAGVVPDVPVQPAIDIVQGDHAIEVPPDGFMKGAIDVEASGFDGSIAHGGKFAVEGDAVSDDAGVFGEEIRGSHGI